MKQEHEIRVTFAHGAKHIMRTKSKLGALHFLAALRDIGAGMVVLSAAVTAVDERGRHTHPPMPRCEDGIWRDENGAVVLEGEDLFAWRPA